jgi:hypothetical protein
MRYAPSSPAPRRSRGEFQDKQMVRITIELQWARFYDFGAGRLPVFLANLAKDG